MANTAGGVFSLWWCQLVSDRLLGTATNHWLCQGLALCSYHSPLTNLCRNSSQHAAWPHRGCPDRPANRLWQICYLLICTLVVSKETSGLPTGRKWDLAWKPISLSFKCSFCKVTSRENTQRRFLSKTCQVHLKPKEAWALWFERLWGPWGCSPELKLLFILKLKEMLVRNQ